MPSILFALLSIYHTINALIRIRFFKNLNINKIYYFFITLDTHIFLFARTNPSLRFTVLIVKQTIINSKSKNMKSKNTK